MSDVPGPAGAVPEGMTHVLRCSACDAQAWLAFDTDHRDLEIGVFVEAHAHRTSPTRAFVALVDLHADAAAPSSTVPPPR